VLTASENIVQNGGSSRFAANSFSRYKRPGKVAGRSGRAGTVWLVEGTLSQVARLELAESRVSRE
jgi:hypothetical protein